MRSLEVINVSECKKGCSDCIDGWCPGGGKCPYDGKHCHDMDFHHFSDFQSLNINWCIPGCNRYAKSVKKDKRKIYV
jgi:hypothetical protein